MLEGSNRPEDVAPLVWLAVMAIDEVERVEASVPRILSRMTCSYG